MDAIIILLFVDVMLSSTAVGILIYNRFTVINKAKEENALFEEMKKYFAENNIKKVGFGG